MTTLTSDLRFPESPRWHDGKLWYLDLPAHALRTVDLEGREETIESFPARPAAFDFLPDGTPLVALQGDLVIVRLGDGMVYADLSHLAIDRTPIWKFGDMVIDGEGRLYVGCVGPREPGTAWTTWRDAVALVPEAGEVRVVADNCVSPNGMVVSADGRSLVLAESMPKRLVRFSIASDGSLTDRRMLADLGEQVPDGICGDVEGSVWVAGVHTGEVVKVTRDGRVTDTVETVDGRFAIATMLGGPDGRHLFVVTCETPTGTMASWDDCLVATGHVECVEVDVPSAGWPSNDSRRPRPPQKQVVAE